MPLSSFGPVRSPLRLVPPDKKSSKAPLAPSSVMGIQVPPPGGGVKTYQGSAVRLGLHGSTRVTVRRYGSNSSSPGMPIGPSPPLPSELLQALEAVRGEWAVGSGQWAVGSGQWAVGSGQWAVGSGQWAVGRGESRK